MDREDKKLTALEAAYRVLVDADRPMTAAEITRHVLEKRMWSSQGTTPDATINARISVDIKTNGAASRFVRVGPSTYAVKGKTP
jgi:restriction system protein